MLMATHLLRKPIILQETGKKIGKVKNLYINFDVGHAYLSYVGYDHYVPLKDKVPDYGSVMMDRAASAGLNSYHVGAAESPEAEHLSMKQEFIIKDSEIVRMDKHGIVVTHAGIDLYQTEITPGIAFDELLTMDAMALDGTIVGTVTDVVLEKTRVLGIELFTEGSLFRKLHSYLPVSKIKNIYDFTIFLDIDSFSVKRETSIDEIEDKNESRRSD